MFLTTERFLECSVGVHVALVIELIVIMADLQHLVCA